MKPIIPETCAEATEIITNSATYSTLYSMDVAFVGTPNYMGLAYFWAHDYRHTLRDCNTQSRVAVHAAWRANKLPLDGVSNKHEAIMGLALKQIADAMRLGEA